MSICRRRQAPGHRAGDTDETISDYLPASIRPPPPFPAPSRYDGLLSHRLVVYLIRGGVWTRGQWENGHAIEGWSLDWVPPAESLRRCRLVSVRELMSQRLTPQRTSLRRTFGATSKKETMHIYGGARAGTTSPNRNESGHGKPGNSEFTPLLVSMCFLTLFSLLPQPPWYCHPLDISLHRYPTSCTFLLY